MIVNNMRNMDLRGVFHVLSIFSMSFQLSLQLLADESSMQLVVSGEQIFVYES